MQGVLFCCCAKTCEADETRRGGGQVLSETIAHIRQTQHQERRKTVDCITKKRQHSTAEVDKYSQDILQCVHNNLD